MIFSLQLIIYNIVWNCRFSRAAIFSPLSLLPIPLHCQSLQTARLRLYRRQNYCSWHRECWRLDHKVHRLWFLSAPFVFWSHFHLFHVSVNRMYKLYEIIRKDHASTNKNTAITDMAAQLHHSNIRCRVQAGGVPVFNVLFLRIIWEYHHKSCIAEDCILLANFIRRSVDLTSTIVT